MQRAAILSHNIVDWSGMRLQKGLEWPPSFLVYGSVRPTFYDGEFFMAQIEHSWEIAARLQNALKRDMPDTLIAAYQDDASAQMAWKNVVARRTTEADHKLEDDLGNFASELEVAALGIHSRLFSKTTSACAPGGSDDHLGEPPVQLFDRSVIRMAHLSIINTSQPSRYVPQYTKEDLDVRARTETSGRALEEGLRIFQEQHADQFKRLECLGRSCTKDGPLQLLREAANER